MAITISGENNSDKILAADGVIDQLSGFNIVGVITATSFTGNLTGNVTGNLTGNVNSTSPLLLQTGGSERFRITGNNELGIAGANYGSSGQVLTSGGSGSSVSWTTIPTQVTISNNAVDRVITGGSGTNLNGESYLTFSPTSNNGLDVTRTNANTAAMFRGHGGAGTIGLYDTTNSKLLFLSNSNGDFNVQTSDNSYFKKLTVKQNGKVGIATDNPQTELEIHGGSGGTIRLAKGGVGVNREISAGDTLGKIEFRSYDGSLNYNSYNATYTEIETVAVDTLGGPPGNNVRLDFKIADSDEPASGKAVTPVSALSILQGGKIGIATESPLYRLDIGDGANDPPSGYQFRINAAGDYIFALAKQGNPSFSIRNNSTSVVHLNTQNSKRLALGVSSGSNSGSIEDHVNINSSGSFMVGASTYGAAGSFSVGANGTFRSILASGTAQDTLICGISGVSNGFQITTAANNVHTYKFHSGTSQALTITDNKTGVLAGSPFSRFQCGNHTFNGGHAMYTNDRVGMSNHGSLTGLMLASTYNDATHPEYGLVFVQGPTTSNYNVWSVSPDGPAKGDSLNFHYAGYSGSGSNPNVHVPAYKKFEMNGDGNFHITAGNLKFANGYGVDFSATGNSGGTMTSELLHDYEEGTFTPTIIRSSAGYSGNYNYQHGVYTRIGRLVHCYIDVDINNFSGGGGHVGLSGLPYTVSSHGLPGWPHSMHMARMYLDGDYAAGVDARTIRFSGTNYGYVMNIDDDTWDYGNYTRVIFTGSFTFMVS